MDSETVHNGGCHCGAVRYQVSGLDLDNTITCNCSRCSKLGSVLSFVPIESFNLKVIHHLFCSVCGVQSFSRGVGQNGQPMVAVNVRCLDDVDLELLSPQKFNGKDY